MRRWQSVWQSKYQKCKKQGKESKVQEGHTKQLINFLLALGAYDSRLYPNFHHLLFTACTPVYHKCRRREVIFSTEEIEDLYARSTMAEERLAHLSSPCITKTGYQQTKFVQNHQRRLLIQSFFERDIVAPQFT